MGENNLKSHKQSRSLAPACQNKKTVLPTEGGWGVKGKQEQSEAKYCRSVEATLTTDKNESYKKKIGKK